MTSRFTAAACASAAAAWREHGSPAQLAFVPTLEEWAAKFTTIAEQQEADEQPDLFSFIEDER